MRNIIAEKYFLSCPNERNYQHNDYAVNDAINYPRHHRKCRENYLYNGLKQSKPKKKREYKKKLTEIILANFKLH